MDDQTLIYQLKDDLQEVFNNHEEYNNVTVKQQYDDFPSIEFPVVVIYEIENTDVSKFYDGREHISNISYQIIVYAEQSATKTASDNVQCILNIIRDYMRGPRYHALRRIGNTPITKKHDDDNVKIGYVRYVGRLNIDTNTIYRRN